MLVARNCAMYLAVSDLESRSSKKQVPSLEAKTSPDCQLEHLLKFDVSIQPPVVESRSQCATWERPDKISFFCRDYADHSSTLPFRSEHLHSKGSEKIIATFCTASVQLPVPMPGEQSGKTSCHQPQWSQSSWFVLVFSRELSVTVDVSWNIMAS